MAFWLEQPISEILVEVRCQLTNGCLPCRRSKLLIPEDLPCSRSIEWVLAIFYGWGMWKQFFFFFWHHHILKFRNILPCWESLCLINLYNVLLRNVLWLILQQLYWSFLLHLDVFFDELQPKSDIPAVNSKVTELESRLRDMQVRLSDWCWTIDLIFTLFNQL